MDEGGCIGIDALAPLLARAGSPLHSQEKPRKYVPIWSQHMKELDISTKNCIVEQDGHVLIVTLNRPEAKNAFSPEMLLGMYKAWQRLEHDDGLYCAS